MLSIKNQEFNSPKKVVSFFNFRRSIAKGLMSEWWSAKKIVSTPQKTVPKPLEAQAMSLWGECHLDKQTKRRLCSYCKKREIKYICGECDVAVCDIPCYDLHRKKNVKNL